MNEGHEPEGSMHYAVREVVAVFAEPGALESAVDQLQAAGIDRALISVLGTDDQRAGQVGKLRATAEQVGDDPTARHAAFVSTDSRTEGKAFAIAIPMEIGGMAGAWAVAAAGGALAAAVGLTVVGGVVGAGLGALLLRAVARHHLDSVRSALSRGGTVIWVTARDPAAEQLALEVLARCGGTSVHAHQAEHAWGPADRPLYDKQPDPFLEREPS